MKTLLTTLALAVLAFVPAARAETFTIDKAHSSIVFTVEHNGVSKVAGMFHDFEGTIVYDKANPAATKVDFSVNTESVFTGNKKRDDHLKGNDFFKAKQFPTATFKSTKVVADGDDELKITGDFTLLGVTKEITIEADFTGMKKGDEVIAGGKGEFTIDRGAHGMTYGQGAVGNEVEVDIYLQGKASGS